MGDTLSKVYVLEKKNFDQDPQWIALFSKIQYPKKDEWISIIRSQKTYLDSLQFLCQMSNDIHDYYLKYKNRNTLMVISYELYAIPCPKTLDIFKTTERNEHFEKCTSCRVIYELYGPCYRTLNSSTMPEVEKQDHLSKCLSCQQGIQYKSIRDIQKALEIELRSLNDFYDSQMYYTKQLEGFLETECYREILEIPEELSEKQIILAEKRSVKMTVGELFEMIHDIWRSGPRPDLQSR